MGLLHCCSICATDTIHSIKKANSFGKDRFESLSKDNGSEWKDFIREILLRSCWITVKRFSCPLGHAQREKQNSQQKHGNTRTRTAENKHPLARTMFVSYLIVVTCRFPRLYLDPFENYREIETHRWSVALRFVQDQCIGKKIILVDKRKIRFAYLEEF